MKLFDQLRLLERLDQLIRLKATGTPAQLASRIEMSERQMYRLIQELKDMGFPIEYCKDCQCYRYTEAVKLHINIQIAQEEMIKIKGGQAPQKLGEDYLFPKPADEKRNLSKL